jgi:precorrin-4 methylase
VISDGTTPQQRVLTSTLGAVADEAVAAGFRPPAVVVVGDVVGLRSKLQSGFASTATDAAAWYAAETEETAAGRRVPA